jgi:hypothetical protein
MPCCPVAARETSKALPKLLRGSVHAQWVKCGKPGCQCSRGHLHGPYYYRFWREDGRLRKEYVARTDLAGVLRAIEARRTEEKQIKDSWRVVRTARAKVRGIEDSISEGREST